MAIEDPAARRIWKASIASAGAGSGKIDAVLAASILLVPVIAFSLGVFLLGRLRASGVLKAQLSKSGATRKDRTVPWLRFFGYSTTDLKRFLALLDGDGQEALAGVLRADLYFPLLYGAGFAVSGLLTRSAGARPELVFAIFTCGGALMVSDWIENASLLKAMANPGSHWVSIGSGATMTKLAAVGCLWVVILVSACDAYFTMLKESL